MTSSAWDGWPGSEPGTDLALRVEAVSWGAANSQSKAGARPHNQAGIREIISRWDGKQ